MTVINVNNAEYRNRNPKQIMTNNRFIVGPHAVTTRASYTVPTFRMAILESIALSGAIVTAATSPSNIDITVQLSNIGYNGTLIESTTWSIPLGNTFNVNETNISTLYAGDILTINDVDGSTGDNVLYGESSKLVEMDQY